MAIYTNVFLLVFVPIILILYSIVPQKFRWAVLLAASYACYISFSGKLVLLLLATSLVTYYLSRWMEKIEAGNKEALAGIKDRKEKSALKKAGQKKKRRVLALGVVFLLGILFYVQYYNFFASNVNRVLDNFSSARVPILKILFPMGVSFYTLEAIGYLADVYWDRIKTHENPFKLMLFLSFFPQIMEGPIARYTDTADDLYEGKPLTMANLNEGFYRILVGLFKKMVLSDRLSILVSALFNNYEQFHGVMIAVSAIAYTIQLYLEFSGSIDIVIGLGRLFGIKIPENFNQPFSAQSPAEFWRRWHMSLGNWFKNYLFYPITVSGLVKKWNKFARKKNKYVANLVTSAMALFPVWVATGLWHGAEWKYLFYGMYYFVILLLGVALEPVKEKRNEILHINAEAKWFKTLRILKTWCIIFTGELFFNAKSVHAGLHMFKSLFQNFAISDLWNGTFPQVNLRTSDYVVIVVGCVIMWIVGFMKEHGFDFQGKILGAKLPVKWAAYYVIIFAILIFGAYGAGYSAVDLIYAAF